MSVRIAINKARCGSEHAHGFRRSDECMSRNDDYVAHANAKAAQCEHQCVGTVAHANTGFGAAERSERIAQTAGTVFAFHT